MDERLCACCGDTEDDSAEERDCGCVLCDTCWEGRHDECPPERHRCPAAGTPAGWPGPCPDCGALPGHFHAERCPGPHAPGGPA